MIISWILNSTTIEIAQSVVYLTSAKDFGMAYTLDSLTAIFLRSIK